MVGIKTVVTAVMLSFVLCTCARDKDQVSGSASKAPSDEGEFRSLNSSRASIPEIRVDNVRSRIPVLNRNKSDKYNADVQVKYHTEVMDRCRRAVEYFRELKEKISQALPKFETIRRAIIDIKINNADSHPFFQEYRHKSKQIVNAINGEIRYLRKSITIKRELIRYINDSLYGYSIRSIKKLSKMAKKALNDVKEQIRKFDGLEHIEKSKVYILGEEWVKLSFKWIKELKEIIGNKYKVVERYGSIAGFMHIVDEYLDKALGVTRMTQTLVEESEMTPNVQEVITVYDDLDMVSPSESDVSDINGIDFDYETDSSVAESSVSCFEGDKVRISTSLIVDPSESLHNASPRGHKSPQTRAPSPEVKSTSSQDDSSDESSELPIIKSSVEMHDSLPRTVQEGKREFSVLRRWNGDVEVKLYQKMEDPDFAHIEENELGKLFKHFLVTNEMLDCNIISLSGKGTPVPGTPSFKKDQNEDVSMFAMYVENEKLKVLINMNKMIRIEMYIREIESKKSLLLSFLGVSPGIAQTLGEEYIENLQENLKNKFQEILDMCANINWFFNMCTLRFENINFYFSKENHHIVKSLMIVPVVTLPSSKKPIYFDSIGITSRIQMLELYEKILEYQKKVSMIFMVLDASILFTKVQTKDGQDVGRFTKMQTKDGKDVGKFAKVPSTTEKRNVGKFAKELMESPSIRESITGLLGSFVEHYKMLENDTLLLYAVANLFDRNMLHSAAETYTQDVVKGIVDFLSNSGSYKTDPINFGDKKHGVDPTISSSTPSGPPSSTAPPTTPGTSSGMDKGVPQDVVGVREKMDRQRGTTGAGYKTRREVTIQTRSMIRESKYPSGEYRTYGAIPKHSLFQFGSIYSKSEQELASPALTKRDLRIHTKGGKNEEDG